VFSDPVVPCNGFYPNICQSNQYQHFIGNNDYYEFPEVSHFLTGLNRVNMTSWFNMEALIYGLAAAENSSTRQMV